MPETNPLRPIQDGEPATGPEKGHQGPTIGTLILWMVLALAFVGILVFIANATNGSLAGPHRILLLSEKRNATNGSWEWVLPRSAAVQLKIDGYCTDVAHGRGPWRFMAQAWLEHGKVVTHYEIRERRLFRFLESPGVDRTLKYTSTSLTISDVIGNTVVDIDARPKTPLRMFEMKARQNTSPGNPMPTHSLGIYVELLPDAPKPPVPTGLPSV